MYFVLVLTVVPQELPTANIPLVLFPAADPLQLFVEAEVADEFPSVEYVYLFLVEVLLPKLKIPLVAVPAADPRDELADEDVADPLVLQENTYLLRVVVPTPKANMPTVPGASPAALAPNPKPCADAAPFEKIVGIRYPHLYWV